MHTVVQTIGIVNTYAVRCFLARAVVFYGTSYRKEWCEIAGLAIPRNDYALHGDGATRYMILPHPNAYGVSTNLMFQQAGATLLAASIKL
jgi:hypothetical protein